MKTRKHHKSIYAHSYEACIEHFNKRINDSRITDPSNWNVIKVVAKRRFRSKFKESDFPRLPQRHIISMSCGICGEPTKNRVQQTILCVKCAEQTGGRARVSIATVTGNINLQASSTNNPLLKKAIYAYLLTVRSTHETNQYRLSLKKPMAYTHKTYQMAVECYADTTRTDINRYIIKRKVKKIFSEQYNPNDFPAFKHRKGMSYQELVEYAACSDKRHKNYISLNARRQYPDLWNKADFPPRYNTGRTYEHCVKVFNETNNNDQRATVKKWARQKYPNIFNEKDFMKRSRWRKV